MFVRFLISNQWIIPVFWAIKDHKSEALWLDEKQHGGTKQWTRCANRCNTPFCRSNIRKLSVPIQSNPIQFFPILLLNSKLNSIGFWLRLCLVPIFNVSLREFSFYFIYLFVTGEPRLHKAFWFLLGSLGNLQFSYVFLYCIIFWLIKNELNWTPCENLKSW